MEPWQNAKKEGLCGFHRRRANALLFFFATYEVMTSKAGWTKTTSKSNLFNTKTASKTTQKFSFTLCNKSGDSALVNTAKNIELKTVQGFELFPSIIVGENDLKLEVEVVE